MQVPATPQYRPENTFLLVIMIVMICVAVSGATQKFKAFLIIIGWMAAGFAVGLGIGLALGSSAAAGTAAGLLTLVMGLGAAWQRLRRNRKPTVPPPVPTP